MKKTTTLILALSVAAIACRKTDTVTAPGQEPGPSPEPQAISISISAEGFIPDGNDEADGTVAVPEFSEGDACGLYIIKDGSISGTNLKISASTSGGTLEWNAASGEEPVFEEGSRYFIYYPYLEDIHMSDKTESGVGEGASAKEFFARLVSSWTPAGDQSSRDGFTTSDLMIAEGTASEADDNTVQVSFILGHTMALAVITKPQDIYDFREESIPDYTVTYTPEFSGVKPMAYNGKYICIVKPGGVTEIQLSFGEDRSRTVQAGNNAAGTYGTFGISSTTNCTLTAGDYYCRDKDGNGYVIPQTAASTMDEETQVIGVVFHTGRHEQDNLSDYTKAIAADRPVPGDDIHGYVMALTDAQNGASGSLKWARERVVIGENPTLSQGTSVDKTDWNGYYNSCQIHAFSDRYPDNFPMTFFPAALAAETYGQRTVDQDGNPTGDYGWQTRFAAPSGSSGWFLPSAGQVSFLCENQEFLTGQIQKVKESIPESDPAREYIGWIPSPLTYVWTSTEYGNQPLQAYGVYVAIPTSMSFGDANWQNKDGAYAVRPILAF